VRPDPQLPLEPAFGPNRGESQQAHGGRLQQWTVFIRLLRRVLLADCSRPRAEAARPQTTLAGRKRTYTNGPHTRKLDFIASLFRGNRAKRDALERTLEARSRGPPARARNLGDIVLERADSIDSNAYDIAARQRKVISWNDAGPGHQKHALGKAVVAEEELD
jgi:hypothetical protein